MFEITKSSTFLASKITLLLTFSVLFAYILWTRIFQPLRIRYFYTSQGVFFTPNGYIPLLGHLPLFKKYGSVQKSVRGERANLDKLNNANNSLSLLFFGITPKLVIRNYKAARDMFAD